MLDTFFNPAGVAVIGASRDTHKLGYGVVRNLTEYRYQGKIYPVNPVAREILSHRCYQSIASVPDPVDLAIVVVPAAHVADSLNQCGERGIRHAIVVSGGFRETGPDGKAREDQLLTVAQKYGMRVIGPNCIGTIDTHTPVNTTFVIGMPKAGDIGFVSQSGAMVAAVIDWARGAGVGFSRIVSCGNQVDVDVTEMLKTVGEDPQTSVITAYIEGVTNGREFMEVAEKTAREKPVVVVKAGHGKSGAKAVASHTGAFAGSAEAYNAAFLHSGVLRANTTEELFDWARALAWQPLPQGNRVAVLTNAGGPAILAVDALEEAGMELAPLTEQTKNFLRPRLPAAASVNNPVDVLAGSGPATYALALDSLLSDPTVDAAIVIQAPQDWFLPESLAEVIGEIAGINRKPVLTSIMGLASIDKALAILHQKRVPTFSFPERATSALAAMWARRQWLDLPIEPPYDMPGINIESAREAVSLERYDLLLSAFGINLPPTKLTSGADEAVNFAEEIVYPVVMKLLSKNFSHKSDIGGVKLNLSSKKDVVTAFKEIINAANKANPDAEIEGVLIQKMLAGGQEMIVGFRRDPQFGPLMVVGSGGTEVELIKDVAMGIAPINCSQAEKMINSTLAGIRLKGWRGMPAGDKNALIDVIMRMSQISLDFPEIHELEINPLYVLPDKQGVFALDIRGSIRK
jgi:acetyltransferase